MKILVPEHLGDITLDQYVKKLLIEGRSDLKEEEKEKRLFSLFTGIKYKDLKGVSEKDYNELVSMINIAMSKKPEFQSRFKLNGIEYGFIPDLDEVTKDEFDDMAMYQEGTDNLHKLMAVLFREVTDFDAFGNYTIKDYSGTKERSEIFKQMPMHIVDGALVFFLNLSKELKSYILKYTAEVQQKVKKQ